ncbi:MULTISPECIES: hypothetical protein [Micromonospora]|uniref:hypothetical protein n=1 Tax=Micromonospora TaxID=1873 RepID=UPI0011AFC42A|nr:hypothetical protein [Verrucosispora sp. ts21]
MQPQQHDDPVIDVRHQLIQGLSVLATLGEAGARMGAVGIQRRAAEAEQAAARDRATNAVQRQAQRQAERLAAAVMEERERLARSLDGSWLTEKASFVEAATVWRTAAAHAAGGDPVAVEAVRLAQDRIRQIHPPFMATYDRLRATGKTMEEAMRSAAYDVWETEAKATQPHPAARPHGTRERETLRAGANGRALPPSGARLDELDAAVRAEAVKLAEHVSPEALDRLQRAYRSGGKTPAADAAGLLRHYARDAAAEGLLPDAVAEATRRQLDAYASRQRAEATTASGTADLPRTDPDEHTEGQESAAVASGRSAHDQAGAEAQRARWGRTFAPLTVGVPTTLANKQPANAAAATPRRSR